MLNDKQRIRFLLGLALFVIALCPPWKEFGAQEKPLGFAPMFTPPPVSATASKVDIDFSRLGIEVALVAALGFLLLPPGRPEGPTFVPPVAKNGSNGAGAGRETTASGNANMLRVELPREYYLGELFVESADDSEYWDGLCPARGAFDLPRGKRIQLELAKDLRVDLSFLSAFPAGVIYSIDASDCKISDDDLAKLGSLGGLRELDLSGTAVSSAGVAHLKGLVNLEKLWLDRSLVDDQCVPTLIALSKLKKLSLTETRIGELAGESLKKDLSCDLVLS